MFMLKKLLKYIGVFLLFLFVILGIIANFNIYKERIAILKGYKDKKEHVIEVWQSSANFNTYYYDERFDEKYKNYHLFKKVDDNMDSIFTILNRCNWYDFDGDVSILRNSISKEDYYYLVDQNKIDELKFRLYIYDISEHILYYFSIVE